MKRKSKSDHGTGDVRRHELRLAMLSESIGCALSTLHRSKADADDTCKAAKREIEAAMERLRNASELVSKALGSHRERS
jgi:formate dehydrogenase assembly factor FdhD